MDHVSFSSENCLAIKFIYVVVEAKTIVCSQNTLKKPELAAKLVEKYKLLIAGIPFNHFCKFVEKS